MLIALKRNQNLYDSNFSNVSLLLHGNGVDGSTTFTDNSPTAKTVTRGGSALISATQSKYGGGSIALDGLNAFLSVSSSNDFNFGTGDFTIETWFFTKSQSLPFSSILASGVGSFGSGAVFLMNYGSDRKIAFGTSANNPIVRGTTIIQLNTWYHAAVTRYAGVVRLFINGTMEAVNTNNESINISTNGLLIGKNGWDGSNSFWNGYLDDLRITKGVARYFQDFTPPTAEFPNA